MMRRLTWIMCAALGMVLGAATMSHAEEGEEHESHIKIPKAVAKNLKAKFPEAEIRGVSKEKNKKGKTTYEFNLVIHTKVDVEFEEDGELETVERRIGLFELPEDIRQSAAKRGKIVKAETVTEDEGELKYELVVKGEGKAFELLYSPNGKLLKTEAKGSAGEREDEKAEKHAKKHEGEKRAKAKKHEKEEAHEKGELKKHKHEEEDEPKAKKHEEKEEHEGKAKKHEEREEHEKGKVKKHEKEKEEEEEHERRAEH